MNVRIVCNPHASDTIAGIIRGAQVELDGDVLPSAKVDIRNALNLARMVGVRQASSPLVLKVTGVTFHPRMGVTAVSVTNDETGERADVELHLDMLVNTIRKGLLKACSILDLEDREALDRAVKLAADHAWDDELTRKLEAIRDRIPTEDLTRPEWVTKGKVAHGTLGITFDEDAVSIEDLEPVGLIDEDGDTIGDSVDWLDFAAKVVDLARTAETEAGSTAEHVPPAFRRRAIDLVLDELDRARGKHPKPYNSAHEAFAVLLEEVDEFRDVVWDRDHVANNGTLTLSPHHAKKLRFRDELVQVAAVAIRAIEDLELPLEGSIVAPGREVLE